MANPTGRTMGVLLNAGVLAWGCKRTTAPLPVIKATMHPNIGGLEDCASLQFSVSIVDQSGAAVMADSIAWRSTNPDVASVTSTGVVHSHLSAPSVTIQATAYALSTSASAQEVFAILPGPTPCP